MIIRAVGLMLEGIMIDRHDIILPIMIVVPI